jgi:hypothetical protein
VQEQLQRNLVTRKQLSNIFAAREDMLKAVGRMERVFANGEMDEAVSMGLGRLEGGGIHHFTRSELSLLHLSLHSRSPSPPPMRASCMHGQASGDEDLHDPSRKLREMEAQVSQLKELLVPGALMDEVLQRLSEVEDHVQDLKDAQVGGVHGWYEG